jgi:hypothetical protein
LIPSEHVIPRVGDLGVVINKVFFPFDMEANSLPDVSRSWTEYTGPITVDADATFNYSLGWKTGSTVGKISESRAVRVWDTPGDHYQNIGDDAATYGRTNWQVNPDGWFCLATTSGYQLEWRISGGTWVAYTGGVYAGGATTYEFRLLDGSAEMALYSRAVNITDTYGSHVVVHGTDPELQITSTWTRRANGLFYILPADPGQKVLVQNTAVNAAYLLASTPYGVPSMAYDIKISPPAPLDVEYAYNSSAADYQAYVLNTKHTWLDCEYLPGKDVHGKVIDPTDLRNGIRFFSNSHSLFPNLDGYHFDETDDGMAYRWTYGISASGNFPQPQLRTTTGLRGFFYTMPYDNTGPKGTVYDGKNLSLGASSIASVGTGYLKIMAYKWGMRVSDPSVVYIRLKIGRLDTLWANMGAHGTLVISTPTTGAAVYYNLGSGWTLYAGPITLSADTTVQFYAHKSGRNDSDIFSRSIKLSDPTDPTPVIFWSGVYAPTTLPPTITVPFTLKRCPSFYAAPGASGTGLTPDSPKDLGTLLYSFEHPAYYGTTSGSLGSVLDNAGVIIQCTAGSYSSYNQRGWRIPIGCTIKGGYSADFSWRNPEALKSTLITSKIRNNSPYYFDDIYTVGACALDGFWADPAMRSNYGAGFTPVGSGLTLYNCYLEFNGVNGAGVYFGSGATCRRCRVTVTANGTTAYSNNFYAGTFYDSDVLVTLNGANDAVKGTDGIIGSPNGGNATVGGGVFAYFMDIIRSRVSINLGQSGKGADGGNGIYYETPPVPPFIPFSQGHVGNGGAGAPSVGAFCIMGSGSNPTTIRDSTFSITIAAQLKGGNGGNGANTPGGGPGIPSTGGSAGFAVNPLTASSGGQAEWYQGGNHILYIYNSTVYADIGSGGSAGNAGASGASGMGCKYVGVGVEGAWGGSSVAQAYLYVYNSEVSIITGNGGAGGAPTLNAGGRSGGNGGTSSLPWLVDSVNSNISIIGGTSGAGHDGANGLNCPAAAPCNGGNGGSSLKSRAGSTMNVEIPSPVGLDLGTLFMSNLTLVGNTPGSYGHGGFAGSGGVPGQDGGQSTYSTNALNISAAEEDWFPYYGGNAYSGHPTVITAGGDGVPVLGPGRARLTQYREPGANGPSPSHRTAIRRGDYWE